MRNKKKSLSLFMALLLILTTLTQLVPAAVAQESAAAELPAVVQALADDGLANADKLPKQVNVHFGTDPSTQMNFTYTTAAEANTQVVITKPDGSVVTSATGDDNYGQGGKYFHSVAVSGLSPDTDYEYKAGFGENTYAGSFKTAPAKGSKESIKFAYLADTQVSNATNAEALGATLAEVAKTSDLDFVYLAGDVTDTATNEAQWEWLFNNSGAFPTGGQDMFGSLAIAVTQGNHDNGVMYRHINAPAEAGNIVYSFDYGPLTMIILNLESARSDADAKALQTEYLRAAVADAKARGQWTAVGFHKSLYTGASHITDSDVISARTYWCPIFAELDVDMVLQGHDHVYSRGFVNADGTKADKSADADGNVIGPDNAPLYMVGGHAGGLKWYSKKNYTVTPGDPLISGYDFLDVNSTDTGSDIKKEQVIVEMEISENEFSVNTYMFKYDEATDTITTPKYLYDSVTVVREASEADDVLNVTTDANLVKQGDYFRVNAGFEEEVASNAAILTYSFDSSKFEYRGYTAAAGETVLDTQAENGTLRLTVMKNGYATKSYGTVLFSVKEDADVKSEDNSVALQAEYAVKAADGSKSIKSATASTSFTSSGGTAGDVNGNGSLDLIDLSDLIDAFGMTSADPQWNKYKFFDYNKNGQIDIFDISSVAKLIK